MSWCFKAGAIKPTPYRENRMWDTRFPLSFRDAPLGAGPE
jgi:hypothetical protein